MLLVLPARRKVMHYRLVAKTADFTPEELLEKLQGFMPVAD